MTDNASAVGDPGAVRQDEYEALARFRKAVRRFLAFSEAAARREGITPQQHQALLAIKGFPGREMITVGELADEVCIKHHSAVELIDRLSRAGLVERRDSTEDRRRVLLALTPKAEKLLEALSFIHLDELRRVGPLLADQLSRIGNP